MSSLWRRRYRAAAGYLAGYLGLWTVAGAAALAGGALLTSALGQRTAIAPADLGCR